MARRKSEFQIIFQNQRFDEMPDILSTMAVGEAIGQVEKPEARILETPTIQTGEGSFPYLAGRIAIQNSQQKMELLDYLLDMDEETIPDVLNKTVFDIDTSLAPKSERIRTVRDYRDMYFKIYPVDQNEEELIRMSLAVLKKLYLLLNEDMRLLKELKSKMKERGDIFQDTVITPRLNYLSIVKYSMLEAFKKIERLYEDKDYEGARQEAFALYKTELYKKIFSNSYPTIINLAFIDLLKEEANDPDIQDVLKRLNEIDFGSCRLIEFITTALSEDHSVLRYPYAYDFNNIFLFGKTEGPWENFSRYFKEKEKVDISGIKRMTGNGSRTMDFIAFGETIEIMMYELLKNAITNADYEPKTRKLKGEIQENFEDTPEGYCYTMEDNNAGISRDRLRSVFNICVSYTHFDPERPRYEEFAGLGIGLAKVLAIVDMYGGTLRVISRVEGEKAYELNYKEGAFSTIEPIDENNSEGPLLYKTGTKFFITFPYSIIDMEQVLPGKDQRADGYLPLIRSNEDSPTENLASNKLVKDWSKIKQRFKPLIDTASSQDELKRIYRRMAFETHPDHNPEDYNESHDAFKELSNYMQNRLLKDFRIKPLATTSDWMTAWAAGESFSAVDENGNEFGQFVIDIGELKDHNRQKPVEITFAQIDANTQLADGDFFGGERERYLRNITVGVLPKVLEDRAYSYPWPVDMTDPSVHIIGLYGEPHLIKTEESGNKRHFAIDIQTQAGSEVRAVEDGFVVFVQIFDGGMPIDSKAYSFADVWVYSPSSNLLWLYVHLNKDSIPPNILRHHWFNRYEKGENFKIKTGDIIGEVNKWHTDNALKHLDLPPGYSKSYDHLHLEVRYVDDLYDGWGVEHLTPVNPLQLLKPLYQLSLSEDNGHSRASQLERARESIDSSI